MADLAWGDFPQVIDPNMIESEPNSDAEEELIEIYPDIGSPEVEPKEEELQHDQELLEAELVEDHVPGQLMSIEEHGELLITVVQQSTEDVEAANFKTFIAEGLLEAVRGTTRRGRTRLCRPN